eukprot:2136202-Alexandrium_andersonii.AAC.1
MAGGLDKKAGKKEDTSAGRTGKDSFNSMAFPLLIWLMRRARPDLEARVLVENAPDIGEPHRAAMKKMLA